MRCLNAMKSSVRAHRADSEDDGSGEHDCGEECSLTPVVACSDVLPVLETPERGPPMCLQRSERCVSCLTVLFCERLSGMQLVIPLPAKQFQKQSASHWLVSSHLAMGSSSGTAAAPVYSLSCPAVMTKMNGAIILIRCGMKPWCSYHLSCGRSGVLRLLLPAGWKPCGMP